MNRRSTTVRALLPAVFSILAGCGGGGGSGSDSSPPPAPTAPPPQPMFDIALEASAESVPFDGAVTLTWSGDLGPESGFSVYKAADYIPIGEPVIEATGASGSVEIEGIKWDTVFRVLKDGTEDFAEGGGDSVTVSVNRETYPEEQGILEVINDRLWVWLSDIPRDGSNHLDEEGEVDWRAINVDYARELLDMGRYFMVEEVDWVAQWDVHSFQAATVGGFSRRGYFRDFREFRSMPRAQTFISPLDRRDLGLSIPSHEIMHFFARWNSNEWIPDAEGLNERSIGGHWGVSDVAGVLGGFETGTIRSLGGDVYTGRGYAPYGGVTTARHYSPLELYYMGFVGVSEVPTIEYPVGAKILVDDDGALIRTDENQVQFEADHIASRPAGAFTQYRDRVPDHLYNEDPSTARRHFRQLSIWTMDAEHIPAYAELGYLAKLLEDYQEQSDNGFDDGFINWYEVTAGHSTIETGRLSEIMYDVPLPPIEESEFLKLYEASPHVPHNGCDHSILTGNYK